ncbi:hypothetical protein L3X38_038892 [Prunus dulcis]|uniref:Uncharacterized protein n=1 Tax=Prunus dulcis TaxID=3755 RepID=A0AAD4V615_PRUDU|nr:hypothetical protein L3X38_038892 [Prunus dulcis]
MSRVSGTPKPCGARIAALIEVVSPRPPRNAAEAYKISAWLAKIAARMEVVSPRPARMELTVRAVALKYAHDYLKLISPF